MANSIYTPGFGAPATWGTCTGHLMDPRTVIDEDELADAIAQAIETLEAAPAEPERQEGRELAAQDAAATLLCAVDVVAVLRQVTLSPQQVSGIAAMLAAKLGQGKTQAERLEDKAIAGLDAAVVALWEQRQ